MPGTPDPVLGSDGLTMVVSALVAVVAVASILVATRRSSDSFRTALTAGLGYAALTVFTWLGARVVASAPIVDPLTDPAMAGFYALVGGVMLCLQAAVPAYLYARWRLMAPLVGLVVATTVVLFAFLRVAGETDPLSLYLVLGPVVSAALAVIGAVEMGIRQVFDRISTGAPY